MRFHLHQNMLRSGLLLVSGRTNAVSSSCSHRHKALYFSAFHNRCVVGVRHQHMLRIGLMGVADHAKQTVRLVYAINGELGVKNFVAAMFAIGLCEHHQLHIRGVTLELGKGLH